MIKNLLFIAIVAMVSLTAYLVVNQLTLKISAQTEPPAEYDTYRCYCCMTQNSEENGPRPIPQYDIIQLPPGNSCDIKALDTAKYALPNGIRLILGQLTGTYCFDPITGGGRPYRESEPCLENEIRITGNNDCFIVAERTKRTCIGKVRGDDASSRDQAQNNCRAALLAELGLSSLPEGTEIASVCGAGRDPGLGDEYFGWNRFRCIPRSSQ